MGNENWGGSWTQEKLTILENYLNAYMTIMKGNKRARYFKTIYIDAFAGTGKLYQDESPDMFEEEMEQYQKGSASIAVGLQKPFDEYYFIENSKKKCKELEEMFSYRKNITILYGDANNEINRICEQYNWEETRAVVFLDPYGMQVRWDTIELIAATKAIDMWYLFPLGIGVMRLMKRDGKIDLANAKKLNEILGDEEWKGLFYETRTVKNLFGEEDITQRKADYKDVLEYINSKLDTIFKGIVKNPKIFYNSKKSPMFSLCFAAEHDAAIKIAKYLSK